MEIRDGGPWQKVRVHGIDPAFNCGPVMNNARIQYYLFMVYERLLNRQRQKHQRKQQQKKINSLFHPSGPSLTHHPFGLIVLSGWQRAG